MFIITAKVSGKKLAIGAAILAAVLLAVGVGAGLAENLAAFHPQDERTAADGSAEQTTAQASTSAWTAQQRIAYLEACGWEVDASTGAVKEVIIPSDFDETYQSYADLQAKQGFELEKYRGKRVKQIIYEITNDGEEELMAELLVYRGKIIAGDVFSMKTDGGFTRGLMEHSDTDVQTKTADSGSQ